jgi:ubiquinone/menaquinone biosynthesis C-methylase UbiE
VSRILSRQAAKAFYDRFGRRQDWQAFYEDPAVEDMIAHGCFETAQAVCEFGCGTGRLAAGLLAKPLPESASYLGLDSSETMVRLATDRVARWPGRARVLLTDGTPRLPAGDGSFDRLVSTYVLDLLSEQDIRDLLVEARRVLVPQGLLCIVNLTHGRTPFASAVTWLWQRVHAWRPGLVGGCRPIELRDFLADQLWHIRHQAVVCRFGISSEIVVAAPR